MVMSVSTPESDPLPVALLFPGQGSQFAGMAADLIRESSRCRELFDQADDILGIPLRSVMTGSDEDALRRTVYTQPAVFVHSIALWELLREQWGGVPVIAAGHSLGEYSALCAAGIMAFEDALRVIRVRSAGMDRAQPSGTTAMAALIGMTRDEAREVVETHRESEVLAPANFNGPDQTVISGHTAAVNRVLDAVKGNRRVRGVMLPVSAAFHTELMQPVQPALAECLATVRFHRGAFPVVANVNARSYPEAESAIRATLVEQVVNPVLWEDCVRTMAASGATLMVEIGPGKVLTGLLKRIDRNLRGANVSDFEGIRAFVEANR